jgi:hypothetical protein
MKAMMNESQMNLLSEKYLSALRNHVDQDPQSGFEAAHDLGKAAVSIGLETLDLAKIHEHALTALRLPENLSNTPSDLTKLAVNFFTEANTPIEETHRAALRANADLYQLNAKLDERTHDLADSKRNLQQQITGRTKAEAALRDSEAASRQLLADSRKIELHLQKTAHGIMAATEAERTKMSLQLNDEIAQGLLGINIRLLALKQQVATRHSNLSREIAATRKLIEESVNIITRLAHEFSSQHQPPTD